MSLNKTEIRATLQSSFAWSAAVVTSLLALTCLGAEETADTDQQRPQPWIQVGKDTMSVALEEAAFEEVIAEVARQGGFEASLTTDESMGFVTDSFTGVPTIEGLRRLIADRSHVLVLSEAEGVPDLVRLLVLSGTSDAETVGQPSVPVSEAVYVQPDELIDPRASGGKFRGTT